MQFSVFLLVFREKTIINNFSLCLTVHFTYLDVLNIIKKSIDTGPPLQKTKKLNT